MTIGNNVIIAHGSMIHCARIGNNVLIGTHAVLGDQSEIEDDCMIGACSMVRDHFKVPTKSLALGVPARVVRALGPRELEQILNGTRTYAELAKKFKKSGL
jgi:carbonic anhydrase/acetyltransferase-like protein (isoleucine patch superfamily)